MTQEWSAPLARTTRASLTNPDPRQIARLAMTVIALKIAARSSSWLAMPRNCLCQFTQRSTTLRCRSASASKHRRRWSERVGMVTRMPRRGTSRRQRGGLLPRRIRQFASITITLPSRRRFDSVPATVSPAKRFIRRALVGQPSHCPSHRGQRRYSVGIAGHFRLLTDSDQQLAPGRWEFQVPGTHETLLLCVK